MRSGADCFTKTAAVWSKRQRRRAAHVPHNAVASCRPPAWRESNRRRSTAVNTLKDMLYTEHYLLIAPGAGVVQRRHQLPILSVGIGALLQQHGHNGGMPLQGRPMQAGVVVRIPHIHMARTLVDFQRVLQLA